MNFTATFIGQMISFIFFVWFCGKWVWPPITQALEERKKKIADGLEAAEKGEKSLETAQIQVDAQMKEAKTEASSIIDQANKRAIQIVDEAKEQAREEGQRLIAGAQAEIDQQVNQAKEHLRSQVAGLVIAGAEKILESTIDESAHSELTDKLAASL